MDNSLNLAANKLTPYLPELKKALNAFLDWLLTFPGLTEEQSQAAKQIRKFDFRKRDGQTDWYASLDILDYELQTKTTDRTGPFIRTWAISYQCHRIEIKAESKIDFNETDATAFEFFFSYFFDTDEIYPNTKTTPDFASFIEDAQKYESYITEHLREIEPDIAFWEQ